MTPPLLVFRLFDRACIFPVAVYPDDSFHLLSNTGIRTYIAFIHNTAAPDCPGKDAVTIDVVRAAS